MLLFLLVARFELDKRINTQSIFEIECKKGRNHAIPIEHMITHVAIRVNEKVWALPKPNRHHDVIRLIYDKTGQTQTAECEQGFLDHEGRFLRREPALLYAIACKQLNKNPVIGGKLFSENLW